MVKHEATPLSRPRTGAVANNNDLEIMWLKLENLRC